jgi:hypothetical protein
MRFHTPPSRLLRPLQLSIALLAFGCDGDPTATEPVPSGTPVPPTPEDTAPPTPITPVDTGADRPVSPLPACASLAVDPAGPLQVQVGGTRFLAARNVLGDVGFAVDPPDAGTITATGLFTAATSPGPLEVVVTDSGCIGEVVVAIDVVPALTVSPLQATVPPGSTVQIVVDGGSGAYTCTLLDPTLGTLAGCAFTAGSSAGGVAVEVTDDATGALETVSFVIDAAAALTTRATSGWMAPVGSPVDLEIDGGSGEWQLAPGSPGWLTVVPDPLTGEARLQATTLGAAAITVEDAHVPGLSVTRAFQALEPRSPPTHASGVNNENPRVIEQDLDGDGLPELIVGEKDASVGADRGGVVHVYPGTATGPDITSPTWTLVGEDDLGQLGAGIALGDLDGDGVQDLVVGAPNVNWIANRAGEVSVFLGDGLGGFVTPAAHVFNGQGGNHRLGLAVATCDLDGDGLTDLIASADSVEPVSGERTGAIWFWRQGATGLPLTAEQRHGLRFDGTAWVPVGGGRMGTSALVVGDVDHDGRCDVVAELQSRDWTDGTTGPGFVLAYGGDPTDGLSLEPIRAWTTTGDNAVRFGRSLALGDVDGVTGPGGLPDDLLVGASGWDGAGSSYGRALLFPGGPGGPLVRSPADATWSLAGVGNNDQVGQGVAVAGDGDLVVSGLGERKVWRVPGGTDHVAADLSIDAVGAGTQVFEPVLEPTDTIGFAGTSVAAVGDGVFFPSRLDRVQPDGTVDAVDVTGLHLVAADGTTTTWTLDQPAGDLVGYGLDWFDVDGDGTGSLVVGAPEHGRAGQGALSGAVFVDDGAWTEVSTTGPTFGNNDRRGWGIATGDVDGDGTEDLIVAARTDSRPAAPTVDAACPGGGARNNVGHVAVYLGGTGGIGATPDLIWWPPATGPSVRSVQSGFDANGDGRDDIVVGMSGPRAAVVYGAAAPPAGAIHELCDGDYWTNTENGAFGDAVTAMGDVDGDGCDEVAIAAPTENLGITNRGVVRVFWGYGPTCGRAAAEVTVLARDRPNERWGAALAGGHDLTGDGVPDLVVTSHLRPLGGDRVGGVVLVDGATLAALPTGSPSNGVVPDGPIHGLAPGRVVLESWMPSTGFGSSVAVLPGARIAVGLPDAVIGPVGRGGAVAVYGVDQGDLDPAVAWWVGGDVGSRVGRFGETLVTDANRLLIGAPGADANGHTHVGAAYVASF